MDVISFSNSPTSSKNIPGLSSALLICLSSWFSLTHPKSPSAPQSMDRSNAANRRLSRYQEGTAVDRTGKVLSEEVVEKMISEAKSVKLIKTAICSSGRGKVTETLSEIQGIDDKDLEKSLLELHQLFLDMKVIVEVQGEKMDGIERHFSNAAHQERDPGAQLC